jgi:hypothetical protein
MPLRYTAASVPFSSQGPFPNTIRTRTVWPSRASRVFWFDSLTSAADRLFERRYGEEIAPTSFGQASDQRRSGSGGTIGTLGRAKYVRTMMGHEVGVWREAIRAYHRPSLAAYEFRLERLVRKMALYDWTQYKPQMFVERY